MKFHFHLAKSEDSAAIMALMTHAKETVAHKEWFVDDDQEYIEKIIAKNGFIILAKPENENNLAGFFIVKFPGNSKDNLGYFLNFSETNLNKSVHMDSAVVHSAYRGHHLQAQMAAVAESMLQQLPYRYLFATIHPDNKYSLQNMIACGYEIIASAKLYGGLDRVIIYKEL